MVLIGGLTLTPEGRTDASLKAEVSIERKTAIVRRIISEEIEICSKFPPEEELSRAEKVPVRLRKWRLEKLEQAVDNIFRSDSCTQAARNRIIKDANAARQRDETKMRQIGERLAALDTANEKKTETLKDEIRGKLQQGRDKLYNLKMEAKAKGAALSKHLKETKEKRQERERDRIRAVRETLTDEKVFEQALERKREHMETTVFGPLREEFKRQEQAAMRNNQQDDSFDKERTKRMEEELRRTAAIAKMQADRFKYGPTAPPQRTLPRQPRAEDQSGDDEGGREASA
uniref:Uncharacterized protein n=1 Tax=Chromera velia CCMP2878 TaxID=1169474 RepID=A0A0G4F1J4_9ALVE|eukprot:Cvel_14730.t1-p1 / transcript=Cvel_14730.t1 / gene=Cvel_14730 / organism=Chromera_velia_CCMP2878 / gene_product=hypothetical protein / transcript_product=hypothetical protein / location=Cvel_scaffold1059:38877-43670(+) / protein_length=287 / sequence_SO=supercontig / SO=protein_coding / is_pseudo=false